METFDIRHAKVHLSRLVEQASRGEAFIISKAGKPLVKVDPLEPPPARAPQIIGFMEGQIQAPDDFDTMGQAAIEAMFYGY